MHIQLTLVLLTTLLTVISAQTTKYTWINTHIPAAIQYGEIINFQWKQEPWDVKNTDMINVVLENVETGETAGYAGNYGYVESWKPSIGSQGDFDVAYGCCRCQFKVKVINEAGQVVDNGYVSNEFSVGVSSFKDVKLNCKTTNASGTSTTGSTPTNGSSSTTSRSPSTTTPGGNPSTPVGSPSTPSGSSSDASIMNGLGAAIAVGISALAALML